jgi:hypothetical protein
MGTLGRRLIVGMRSGAGLFLLVGAWSLYAAASGPSASAATLDATATITNPVNNEALTSGGSTTVFTVVLTPAPADCSGDTATDGYEVFSYLLPEATTITSDDFSGGSPSEGSGLADGGGYYGSATTAPTTGQIISIPPDFEWFYLLSLGETAAQLDGGSSATWNAGIACANSSGVMTDYWNTQVTFTADANDPNGFSWTVGAGTGGSTTTTTTTTQPTTGNATTTSPTTTTITPSGGGTTTTAAGSTAAGSTASGSSGSSGSTGSSGGDGSSTPTSSGSLAFTGAFITRSLAIGLLCIGFGLILLGLSVKVRRDIVPRVVLR